MKLAVDSSVIVAAAQSWHERHAAARSTLSAAFSDTGVQVLVPRYCLFEAFSVLTRMPPPHRVSPAMARTVLAELLDRRAAVVPLTADPWELLDRFVSDRVVGGAVYDALIAEAARYAGAGRLLTLNRRHFDRVAPPGLEIVEPR